MPNAQWRLPPNNRTERFLAGQDLRPSYTFPFQNQSMTCLGFFLRNEWMVKVGQWLQCEPLLPCIQSPRLSRIWNQISGAEPSCSGLGEMRWLCSSHCKALNRTGGQTGHWIHDGGAVGGVIKMLWSGERKARGEKLLELAVLSSCHHHTWVSGDRCSKDTRYRVWKGIRKRGNNIQMVQQASGTQTTYWWLYHRELVQVKALRAILQYAW